MSAAGAELERMRFLVALCPFIGFGSKWQRIT